jgi:hypothetical protein
MSINKLIMRLTYVWIIIIGGLIIYPGGIIECLLCGRVGNILIGVISVALGIAGLVSSNPMPGRQ